MGSLAFWLPVGVGCTCEVTLICQQLCPYDDHFSGSDSKRIPKGFSSRTGKKKGGRGVGERRERRILYDSFIFLKSVHIFVNSPFVRLTPDY